MAHRLPSAIVARLEDAIQSASLESASFDSVEPQPGTTITVTRASGFSSTFEGSVTDFIRHKVRLHHGSWIIGPLRAILAWSESVDDGSMAEYRLEDRLAGLWPNPEDLVTARAELLKLQEEVAELREFRRKVEAASLQVRGALDGLEVSR